MAVRAIAADLIHSSSKGRLVPTVAVSCLDETDYVITLKTLQFDNYNDLVAIRFSIEMYVKRNKSTIYKITRMH